MNKFYTLLILSLSSCIYVVEQPRPNQSVATSGTYTQYPLQRDCSCGYVLEKGVDDQGIYFMNVQNQCTGNIKRFIFDKSDWAQYQISDNICLKQNSAW